jgi:hypothetical protein
MKVMHYAYFCVINFKTYYIIFIFSWSEKFKEKKGGRLFFDLWLTKINKLAVQIKERKTS